MCQSVRLGRLQSGLVAVLIQVELGRSVDVDLGGYSGN